MDETKNQPIYYQTLVEGGLNINQAKLYETIVRNGKLPASHAARLANVPRTLGYKALQELEVLGLIEKEDLPGNVATFTAAHPFKFKELVDKRYEKAKDAKNAVEGVLGKLISDFNTKSGAPGLRILEGIAGVGELYEDILNERQPIKLIRSPEDNRHPQLAGMVQKQIEEQKKLGIQTQAITALAEGTPVEIIAFDSERLVTRRIVPREKLAVPAQIIIYANKVAITAYEDAIITTIIENPAIRKTFEMVFDYLWGSAEQDHQRILETIQKK
ncbi:MAG TPA: helix-turn-helix domain-containing protein [Candidatus Paceibacterota bacterium]